MHLLHKLEHFALAHLLYGYISEHDAKKMINKAKNMRYIFVIQKAFVFKLVKVAVIFKHFATFKTFMICNLEFIC